MSLGSITTRSVIGDAIKNVRNKGKLPFCAAGTSTSFTTWYGVVYPANMAEAIAVTGVTNSYQKCDVCHSGGAVDFTAVMDRDSDGKSVVTLAVSGFQPATVGGSSAATATVAGIAALVWGRNTSQTSSQVLTRLRSNSQYAAAVNGQFGYGVINANNATNF
jgi:serine protease